MRRLAKGIAVLVSGALGVLILLAGFYELHDFRPYLSRIDAVYDAMEVEDKLPPAGIQSFVWRVDGPIVDSFAARNLLGEMKAPQGMLAWHYHSFMWELMLRAHFGRAKRLAFYCHYLPYESGTGFSNASQFYFGKLPDVLSLEEIASIVAIGRSPQAYSPNRHPERFQAIKAKLLDAYASGR